jgi:opacity protein-like surface antigen
LAARAFSRCSPLGGETPAVADLATSFEGTNVKRSAKVLLAATSLFMAASAMAGGYYDRDYGRRGGDDGDNTGPYVGMNLGVLQYSEEGLKDLTPGFGMLRLGVPLAPNLAIEGRLGTGLGSSSNDGYRVEENSYYGAYVKGSLPLTPQFSLYAVAGVAGVDMKRNFGEGDTRDGGVSFGVGGDVAIGRGVGINLEWSRLPSGNNAGYDFTNSMLTIGMTWRF